MEIVNYSFYPLTQHLKQRGVVELKDYTDLKKLMILSYMDTRSDIVKRIQKIVDHAISNNVEAVYLRNYDSLQIYLIAQFIKSNIRVFVPFYNKYEVNESIIGKNMISVVTYRAIDNIIEAMYPGFTRLISIKINGEMTIKLDNKMELIHKDWERDLRDFVELLKTRHISDAINLIFRINVDTDRFLTMLMAELKDEEMIEAIREYIVLDSYEVEKYLRLSNYGNERGDREAIEGAIKVYHSMTDEQKGVIGRLKKKTVKRNYDVGFDLTTLYELQGRSIDKPREKASLEEWDRYTVDESRFKELEIPLVYTQMTPQGPRIRGMVGEFKDEFMKKEDLDSLFVKMMVLSGSGLDSYTESVNFIDLHETSSSVILIFSMNFPNPKTGDKRLRETTIAQYFMYIPKSHIHFLPTPDILVKRIKQLKLFFGAIDEIEDRHLLIAKNVVTSVF